jgi:DNA-directed RNA polymerase specialized sigma24 family protein
MNGRTASISLEGLNGGAGLYWPSSHDDSFFRWDTMSNSVSGWIERLKTGDGDAAGPLWRSYSARLIRLARRYLEGGNRSVADEEDVALSAFGSFCRRAGDDRFAELYDRDDLWQILALITRRKACDLHEYHGRLKRDAGRTHSLPADGADGAPVCPTPTPDLAAEMADQVRFLLGMLETAELRQMALWKMDGYSNPEIASLLGCTERTVERKVWIIKQIWQGEADGGHAR